MGIQKMLHKSGLRLNHYAPTILTCMGSVGVVLTAVMTAKATPKTLDILKNAEKEKGEELTKLEIIIAISPVYIPATVIGACTIVCIFGANVLNKKHQAALASAYGLLAQSYQRYRKVANEVFGEDADTRIQVEIAKDVYISGGCFCGNHSIYDEQKDSSSETALFYDSYSQRYFQSTLPKVMNAQYHLNRNFNLRGDACVNEFYAFLGIKDIDGGDEIGWGDNLKNDGIYWIDFENQHVIMEDGMECYIISSSYEPTLDADFYDI